MTSSSSSSRRKEKVVRVTRNANSSGWISDEEIRGKFLYWRHLKIVVPHKYLDLQLFKKEEVFYTNLRVLNGVIHSRVKGVNITIDNNVWSNIVGLKVEGLDSHIRDSDSNKWLTKRTIYINCLRYPGRYKVDKQYLHDGLNKEEKVIAYVLTWLLLPGRFVEDRMSTEDVFLLNAIKTRICTQIAIWSIYQQGFGTPRTVNGWFFTDDQTVGSPPTRDEDHIAFIPQTDFEKYVVDQFR
ncbi:hypothetical protein LR48_Vigan09g078400 [Vigna angularis]|uniref:Uncharacterized protein n=1 Tax=Phaseolus angularis TaxID=3914 RepID=A0A0L9VAM6_PHAAN|nr:hypothetical protein LR48_Vigan09g078400 [Vigna angularis]